MAAMLDSYVSFVKPNHLSQSKILQLMNLLKIVLKI